MRSFYCIPLMAALAACDSGVDVQPAVVQWMEWPTEVPVATPFTVRLVMPFPACHRWVFKPAASADQSAVTFTPYFLVERGEPVCLPSPAAPEVFPVPFLGLDTVSMAPGLATSVARTFEMRGSAAVDVPTPTPSPADSPLRTFGDVTVRLSNPDTSRRNAGGVVTMWVDNGGCVRVLPGGYPGYPGARTGLVLEDQADTTGLNYAFVRGYIHEAATPVCGQTRVFHLVSRN
jgi:hypothetical protein